jgi:hypothetical protein
MRHHYMLMFENLLDIFFLSEHPVLCLTRICENID